MRERDEKLPAFPGRALALLALGLLGIGAALYASRERAPQVTSENTGAAAKPPLTAAAYAGSQSCQACHAAAFEFWQNSHHALAERAVDPKRDTAAFVPPHEIKHATQTSNSRVNEGKFELVTRGVEGALKPFVPERVIGYNPLHQFLIPADKGRMQVTELAVDSSKNAWFDVYGTEDRQPGEWGHWSGRGMTWNSMCANCHNTFLQKNYDAVNDSYATTMKERGVGCEACHGPQAEHVAWQQQANKPARRDPTMKRLNGEQYFAACGACHARRSELTTQFVPGEKFLDHFSPMLPDETETFFADGQVHDEDFEFVSFLGSRMHEQGVRCVTCHEPHGGKVRIAGNALCMQCHNGKIDPAAHSHHKADTPGGNCVDCHMPQTAYMQRHLRRDHGMTIPQPRLSKELGIPNACNRCHTGKSVDWSVEASEKWYSDKLKRSTEARARIIAKARTGTVEALDPLMKLACEEMNPFWKAVAADLLGRYSARPDVRDFLVQNLQHAEPLVRSAAVRALDAFSSQTETRAAIEKLLKDPVRLVRVDAAWTLRASVDLSAGAGRDLNTFLDLNADFPSAVLQRAILNMDRGSPSVAVPLLKRAIEWDGNSVPLRQALATASSLGGDSAEAIKQMEKSCQIEPRNPQLRFTLGLALGEAGKMEQATQAFKDTVALDPRFARAWYNLGLAYSKSNQNAEALDALQHAESADPNAADYPYVRAIVLLNGGDANAARAAVVQALQLDPNHQGARELLQSMLRPKQ